MTRVGLVGLWQETNTYSPRRTELADFAAFELVTGAALVERRRSARSVLAGLAAASPGEAVPVFSARAWPAGPASRQTADELLDRLRSALREAGRLDAVLLSLHGAMVAGGHPDMELDTVRAVRDVVGGVPLAAVHDLHGNPSPELVAECAVLLGYDTYPHADMYERGVETAALLGDLLGGRPLRTLLGKLPLLSGPLAQATDAEPMRGLQARAAERGRRAGVARVSLLPGFPYSDVARAGFSVLVVTDARAETAARGVVEDTLADVEAHRADFTVVRDDAATAVRRALASERRPVLLADVADNVGGGSPGDGTVLLAELLARHARGAVVTLADGEVARRAAAAGVGATLAAEVGGKTDRRHGDPVPVEGRVLAVTDGRYRTAGSWETGQEFRMGVTAALAVGGVTLVVTERAVPPFHAEQLTSVGVQPALASILVAKGAVAWRAAFGDVVGEVIEVATPGVCPVDPAVLPRETVPMRYRPAGGVA
ncbi:MAG TPA: M81 family metallopeptidase [Mycobacteriales bacterium]|nr:M81 family metallopeptidase [Mycobacteriales bacterium]